MTRACSLVSAFAALTLFSCGAPVMAQEASLAASVDPHAAITVEHRMRALDALDRRLAHYVMADRTPAILARLAERRADLLKIEDPEAFRQALNADLFAVSRDKHLQVWIEPRSRDEVVAEAPPASPALAPRAASDWGVREARILGDNVAYLDLAFFSGEPESAAAIDSALAGLAGARALIIDVRNNGGGGEVALRQLVGHLALEPMRLEDISFRRCQPDPADPEGCVQDGGRDVAERYANHVEAPVFPTQPIWVLAGPGSFSAAEALAYGLQAAGRATVVGETTGGGANPSITMDLGPWFTVVMPVGEARHPLTGTNWEGIGVQPDVRMSADQALDEALRRIG